MTQAEARKAGKEINYELQIRRALKAAGIYNAKLELQIVNVAIMCRIRDKLSRDLEGLNITDVEITAAGVEKRVVNPVIPYLLKICNQITDGYEALGLNYNSTPSKINDIRASSEEDKFSEMLKAVRG